MEEMIELYVQRDEFLKSDLLWVRWSVSRHQSSQFTPLLQQGIR